MALASKQRKVLCRHPALSYSTILIFPILAELALHDPREGLAGHGTNTRADAFADLGTTAGRPG